jgi:hypothetical protein
VTFRDEFNDYKVLNMMSQMSAFTVQHMPCRAGLGQLCLQHGV